MEEIEKELTQKYIIPMKNKYAASFEKNNDKIVSKKITDWNYLIFPDAIFAQKAFEYISEDN